MRTAWKLTRLVFRTTGWLVLVACLALLALVGIGPHFGDYRTLTVLSGSMRPGIPVGAMVIVTPESPQDVRAGQIITYRIPVDDRRVVSHRVVRVVEGEGTDHPVVETQGDANGAPDPWLAEISSPEVWQVRYSVPFVGQAIHSLRQPAVHTGAVRVVPAALAALWLVGIWRNRPDEDVPKGAAVGATSSG